MHDDPRNTSSRGGRAFEREKHIYRNEAFAELVKDAIRFFNGSPVHSLPPPYRFEGQGVYALYYTGPHPLYRRYAEINRLAYNSPIYVGKAVPRGWRQGRVEEQDGKRRAELHVRLQEHSRNIEIGEGLELDGFSYRFVIFEGHGADMIGTIEANLIRLLQPLWNMSVAGFGNHTPGRGRFNQAKSDWDVIHPGRRWADKCKGPTNSKKAILASIARHFKSMGRADAE